MADFRRCLYALALVALIAGFTVPASAQSSALICTATANPPIVRAEGYTELLGDIVIDCTGGTPTQVGLPVPQATISVNLGVNNTSAITSGIFTEALLIVDQPNSTTSTSPILNCGAAGAPDTNGALGAGICSIIATANPALTYDGTPNAGNTCTIVPPATNTSLYGCGRPNVFQGRLSPAGLPGQVVFLDVPIDPPGSNNHRIFRITNLRGDMSGQAVSLGSGSLAITADIAVNPTSAIPLSNNTTLTVARVQTGLQKFTTTTITLVGCTANPNTPATVVLTEAFQDAFKPKNIAELLANGTTGPYNYLAGGNPVFATDLRQNVPGVFYDTESGFMSPAGSANPSPSNPPLGIGNGSVANIANGTAFTNAYTTTGIGTAGTATSGTRFILNFSTIPFPTAVSLSVPLEINLINVSGGGVTGAVYLMSQAPGCESSTSGAGPATNPCKAASGTLSISAAGTATAIYEVMFADPGAVERLTVPVSVTVNSTIISQLLSSTTPPIAQVSAGFAPTYSATFVPNPRVNQLLGFPPTAMPIPRFGPPQANQAIFSVNGKCTCNLLFPYVTNFVVGNNQKNYDTGIVIANTSLDPGASFGFSGLPQAGPIQYWFYSRNKVLNTPPGTPDEPAFLTQGNTQCTNSTNPGQCPGNVNVPPGGYVPYIVSSGGSMPIGTGGAATNVLLAAPGFTGYVIAQASFQYCHAFAYISAQGSLPSDSSISVSYLGLVMDQIAPSRQTATNESLRQ